MTGDNRFTPTSNAGKTSAALAVSLSVFVATVCVTVPAAGAKTARQWGRVGKSRLVEDSTHPGATCVYVDGRLTSIAVRPPKVWPRRDYLKKKGSQWVGWQPGLEEKTPDGSWEASVRKTDGLNDYRYQFFTHGGVASKRLGPTEYVFPDIPDGTYRATVTVQWFGADGPQGERTHVVKRHGGSDTGRSCTTPLAPTPSPSPSTSPVTSPSPSPSSPAPPSPTPASTSTPVPSSSPTAPAPTPQPSPTSSPVTGSPLWWGMASRTSLGSVSTAVATTKGQEPLGGDFDGDGFGDVFWYAQSGPETVWWGRADRSFDRSESQIQVASGFMPVAGDFDGDGREDIYWYGPGSLTDMIWWAEPGRAWLVRNDYQITSVWDQLTSGDFNGDGFNDIYFYRNSDHTQACENTLSQAYWWGKTDRSALNSGQTTTTTTNCYYKWFIEDFDGNSRSDLLAYGLPPNSRDSITYRDPTTDQAFTFNQAWDFRPVVGDFDGDGRGDIFWFSPSGTDAQWWGAAVRSEYNAHTTAVQQTGDYFPISEDFDGDNKADILWYER